MESQKNLHVSYVLKEVTSLFLQVYMIFIYQLPKLNHFLKQVAIPVAWPRLYGKKKEEDLYYQPNFFLLDRRYFITFIK